MSSLAIQVNPYLLENSNSKTTNPLNPLVEYDPTSAIKSNSFWSTFHKVAAWTCIVGFTAIAAATIAITTMYWAVHLPIVSIVLLAVALPNSFPAVRYFFDKSTRYAQDAKVDAKLITHFHSVDLEKQLKSLGISSSHEVNSKNLAFLLARHNYYKERQKEVTDLAMRIVSKKEIELKIGSKYRTINPADYNSIEKVNFSKRDEVAIFENILDRWVDKGTLLREAAMFNLKAAHLLKLVENPFEQREISEFMELVTAIYPVRLIAKDNGDKKSDILVKTPRKNYTISELLHMDTPRIAREIFGMRAGSGLFG